MDNPLHWIIHYNGLFIILAHPFIWGSLSSNSRHPGATNLQRTRIPDTRRRSPSLAVARVGFLFLVLECIQICIHLYPIIYCCIELYTFIKHKFINEVMALVESYFLFMIWTMILGDLGLETSSVTTKRPNSSEKRPKIEKHMLVKKGGTHFFVKKDGENMFDQKHGEHPF